MAHGKSKSDSPLVYSTDPNFKLEGDGYSETHTLPPGEQKLRIQLDKKHRAGKAVTLITGFAGREADLEILGKKLKSFCGCGGSVKNGEVIVQGDNREKVFSWLITNGYKASKKI